MGNLMKAWTRRNLTIVPAPPGRCLVIACDSCGAIGMKARDVLKLPTRYVAQFVARVALTEVLCSGAVPAAIANGVAGEMNPTGEETIWGIREELKNACLQDIALAGSTEENFVTTMSAFAITAIGTAGENELKFGNAARGDKFVLFGKPRIGAEVDLRSPGFYTEIKQLLPLPGVREIVPAGFKGVACEMEKLAALNGAAFSLLETDIDYYKSAGPVSCLLVLCAESTVSQIMGLHPETTVVGEIQ